MKLTPREMDKLTLFTAAEVARRRLERGVLLNVPESTALISWEIVEHARDGRTVADPFRPSSEAVDLLRIRAAQLRDKAPADRRSAVRRVL